MAMKNQKLAALAAVPIIVIGAAAWYLHGKNFAVLNPAGTIATQERRLMVTTILLGMIVGVPVYIMLFVIAWRYHEDNTKAKYSPELAGNAIAESIWWGVPSAIILVLSIITWHTSHSLDPRKRLQSSVKPLTVQVVALDWKWLFIYPEQNVASVNFLELPVGTPVTFEVTADAPMNSFWIPQLGGQIYAMPGMSTELNLMASRAGDFRGESANISGAGFSGMHFIAHATDMNSFKQWVNQAKQATHSLDVPRYHQLSQPSQNDAASQFSPVTSNLYANIILQFTGPRG